MLVGVVSLKATEYPEFESKVFRAERRELKGRELSREEHKLTEGPDCHAV